MHNITCIVHEYGVSTPREYASLSDTLSFVLRILVRVRSRQFYRLGHTTRNSNTVAKRVDVSGAALSM